MVSLPALFALAALVLSGQAAAQPAPDHKNHIAIARQIENLLRERAAGYPGSLEIAIETSALDKLPDCRQAQVFLPEGQRLRSRQAVGVRCLAPRPWLGYAQASLGIHGYYYVPVHTIAPGAAVSLDDINGLEADLLGLAPGILADPSAIIGRIAAQRIQIGTPIKAGMLRHPQSIHKGQTVRLEARGLGFLATSEGRALQSGAPGSRIQVRVRSGRVVTGIVLSADTVQIVL